MPDKLFIGRKVKEVDRSPKLDGVTGIRMLVSDNVEINAGTDDSVWEINSPWATQEQADWLLTKMAGYDYQPYTADTAQVDPAAELGDYLTVGGVYSGLFSERNTFGTSFTADIAAPAQQDIDHEYPYKSESERRFSRMAKSMAAEFKIQADQIAAKVSEVGGDNNSFGWSMTVNGMHWYANGSEIMKATQAGLEVVGHIKGGTIQIGSGFSVDEFGNMKANNATLSGTLIVGGSQITAGTLRSGANSGYQWANGSYGGTSPWQYSLTGGGYGFNFNNMQNAAQSYAQPIHASSFRYNGTQFTPRNIVVNGVTYTVLAVPAG